jgi:hypothetical protein
MLLTQNKNTVKHFVAFELRYHAFKQLFITNKYRLKYMLTQEIT